MALLCSCIAPGRGAAFSVECLEKTSFDWPRFLALATNHHVIPLVYQALKAAATQDGAEQIPSEFLSYLHRAYMSIAAHNLRASATLHRLQRLLESKDIRLVPVKGPALAVLAYGSTSMRQFEDLDLIVRQEDLLRAVGLLEQDGYRAREIPPGASRKRYAASLQDWSLQKPGEALHLDLKPVLISHALSGPRSAGLMAEACRPMAMGEGRSLWAPSPESMFLAVCLDGANEMWFKLSSVADAAALLAAYPGADWAGCLAGAARFGQRRSLRVGALVAEAVLGVSLPEAFRKESSRDPVASRLAEQVAGRLWAEVSLGTGILLQTRFAFQTRERMRDRWRFLSRTLFVPGAVELNQFTLPEAAYPLYSCVRPFRLAWDAWRGRSRRISLVGTKPEP